MSRGRSAARALAGLLALAALAPPAAVEAQAAVQRVSGTLSAGEGRHVLPVTPGTLVEVLAASGAFDTVLRVDWGAGDTLTSDDWGQGTDSRILLAVPEGVTSLAAVVSSFDGTGRGDYVVSLRDLGAVERQAFEGELGPSSPLTPKNVPFARHEFRLDGPRSLTVVLESADFDPYLVLLSPGGARHANDDAQGLDAALEVPRAEAGTWTAWATSISDEAAGRYELSVLASRPSEEGLALVEGRLEAGDSVSPLGELYDHHEIALEADGPVAVVLESPDFDVYLSVRLPDGRRFSNDDADVSVVGGWAARVEIPDPVGPLRVWVTSFAAGETGAYTVRVEPLGGVVGGG